MKRYFITGLLIWIPFGITLWVLSLIIGTLDQIMVLLPEGIHPRNYLQFRLPGIGLLLCLAIIFTTGLIAHNVIGERLLHYAEALLQRIPIVNSIYNSVKQVSDTLFSSSGQAFRKAVLIQYPRAGLWTIAFQTGKPGGDVVNHLHGDYMSVYVPTTPNPTSGFFIMLPAADVQPLNMSVDEALKYIISMGVVAPKDKAPAPETSANPTTKH